jgi:hypothetical protein
LTVGWSIWGN